MTRYLPGHGAGAVNVTGVGGAAALGENQLAGPVFTHPGHPGARVAGVEANSIRGIMIRPLELSTVRVLKPPPP